MRGDFLFFVLLCCHEPEEYINILGHLATATTTPAACCVLLRHRATFTNSGQEAER